MRSEIEHALDNETNWRTATSEKIGAVINAIRNMDERVKHSEQLTEHIAVSIDRRDKQRRGWWEIAGNVWRLVKKGGDELMKD